MLIILKKRLKMVYELNNLDKLSIYKLMSNLVVPRPIAWISTISTNNILNLAPFSYFTPLSSNPPTLIVSIGHKKDGSPKDTLKNLRETKICSISIANTPLTNQMHNSAEVLDFNQSEFEKFNIETKEVDLSYPPIPKDVKVAFLGKYYKEVDLDDSLTIPIIIRVEKVYVNDKLVEDKDKIRLKFSNPIARVGAKYYALGKEIKVDE